MLIFIGFLFGVVLFYLFPFFPFSSGIFFIACSVYAIFKKKFLPVVIILAGIFYAYLRFSPAIDSLDVWNTELRVTGSFAPGPEVSLGLTDMETFTIDTAADEESGEEIDGLHDKEVKVLSEFDAGSDARYELLLKTGRDRTRLNPGRMKANRLYGSVVAANEGKMVSCSLIHKFNQYRNDLNMYVLKRFRGDSGALIAAITTGEMSYLSDDIKDAFNATGLAHILSISGTHFGLFSLMIFGVFGLIIRRLPYRALQRLTIYLTPSQAAAILCIPFIVMYLGISGGSVPAIRSFVVISLFLLGLLIGRKGFWLNSLFFAAFVITLWQPDAVLGISFQLSFMAVLFIGYSIETVREAEAVRNRFFRFVKTSVMISLAAALGTAPLVAYYFHYFSLISPLANLVATPLIGSVLVALSLISSFFFLATGIYIFAPLVEITADLSIHLVRLMAAIPHADFKVHAFPASLCIFFYACCLLYMLTAKKKKFLLVSLVPFLLYALLNVLEKKELSVTFLDVGQGDSAVIEFPDRKVIVVDTGRTGREAAAYLGYLGKRDIDALVLTHVHPDHSGGMEDIIRRFRVKELWDNGLIKYPEGIIINASRRALERGDILSAGRCNMTVFHPYREFHTLYGSEYEEENNSSAVFRISGRKSSFLFTGDIEEEAEEDLSHLGEFLRSDVIKVPHHGSRTSAHDGFLEKVSPSIAVISVGRDNSFGHPAPEVIERLDRTQILRTDRDGAIKITEADEGLEIKKYKDYIFEKADSVDKEMRNIKRLFYSW